MDQTNAKQVTKALLATCFVIVIIAGGAFALSTILSNQVGQDNITVPNDNIILSITDPLPEGMAKNTTYNTTVHIDYLVSVTDARLIFTISATGIEAGDVLVTCADDADITVASGTGFLTFTIDIPPIDGDVTLGVTFYAANIYSTDMVVEATTP